MHGFEFEAHFFFNAGQHAGIDADVVLVAEGAVVGEDLDEGTFGVGKRVVKDDVVRAQGACEGGKCRESGEGNGGRKKRSALHFVLSP